MIYPVALLVSAWIEIFVQYQHLAQPRVALLVSAWIEIADVLRSAPLNSRRTPRECVD